MSNATVAYPFDPTGTRASNKITAEHLTIAPPELSEFLFIIPSAAPFFSDSMQVVHLPSQRTLVEGVDYAATHYFHDASMACAKPIYGSLTFFDNQMTGAVRLSYQTLGGDWVLEASKIVSILSNKLVNPRRVTWEQVADLPYAFPPVDHEWHLDDMVGMKEVVEVLEGIREAMVASGEGGLQLHIADKDNPHGVTKTQVGLGAVDNYATATVAEAQAGTAPNRFLTVLRGAQMVQALIGNRLDTHLGRSDNPHNVTKVQVGLGNVQDFGVASQAQAEAGTAANAYMTPQRTAQAIAALATGAFDSHVNRRDNPHGVTKAHVGLGDVENYGVATAVDARAGVSNELYMTPAMTREAITAIALQGVTEHIDSLNNPHNVTKTQVGLGNVQDFPLATQVQAEAGEVNTAYLTPLRGSQLVEALVGGTLRNHLNDSSNPHGVTKAQVGLSNVENFGTASDEQAALGTARNLFMTPASTVAAINAMAGQLVGSHIDDDNNPHRVTAAQVGLGNVDNYATATDEQAAQGASRTLFMTPATTVALINALGGAGGGSSAELQEHLNNLENPHEVSKSQVGLGSVDNYATASEAQAVEGTAVDLFMTPANTRAAIEAQVGASFSQHAADRENPHGVTASQVGAYSAQETDDLLADKLDRTAQATDSERLGGQTYEEVISNAKTVEVYPAVVTGFGQSWTLLGEATLPADMGTDQIPDIVGEVTGGESPSFGIASTFTVHLTPRNLAFSRVTIGTENYSRDVAFGYVREENEGLVTVRLYLRGPARRRAVTVTAISQGPKFFRGTDVVENQEPADIVYMGLVMPPFTRTRPTLGDVAFGELPQTLNTEQVTGQLVEWVSVAESDEDELAVRVVENSLEHDYGNFHPATPGGFNYLYNDLTMLDKWGWDATEEAVLFDSPELEGNATLTANEYLTDYTFEVELGAQDSAAMGVGVLAAVVNQGGRPHAIAVVRTPGGATQIEGSVGNPYKLKTIALNIGETEALDLASQHGTLKWMDTQVADADRDPADFDPASAGWDVAGKVRIRVVRAGNTLTIDVTDFGSTEYVAAEQVVFDLTTQPGLSMFADRPSTWGLITVQQPKATFKVLARPRQYRDYVRIGVPGDNGKQRFYRFDGQVWQMSYLGLTNPQVRPNRLYYSDWNGGFYQSQRNGRLRPIHIEAYSRENPTVLAS